MKKCTKCKVDKSTNEFPKDKNRIDGLFPWCKECKCKDEQQRRKQNREKYRAYNKKRYHEVRKHDPDYVEKSRKQQHKRRQQVSVKRQRAQYSKTYNQQPKVKRRNRQRQRQYGKLPQYKEKKRLRQSHRHAMQMGAPGSYTDVEWQHLKDLADNYCLACNAQTKLTADHITPLIDGGCNCIHNIQPLCLSCNSSKGNRHQTDYRTTTILQWVQCQPKCKSH